MTHFHRNVEMRETRVLSERLNSGMNVTSSLHIRPAALLQTTKASTVCSAASSGTLPQHSKALQPQRALHSLSLSGSCPPSAWGTCPLPSTTPFSFDFFTPSLDWAPYLFVVDTGAPDPLFLVTICTLICWKCQQLLQLSLKFVLGRGVLPPRGCAPPQRVQSQPKTSWFQRYQGLAPLPQFGSTSQGHLSTRVPSKFGWSLAFSLFAGQLLQSCLPHFLTGMCSERPLQSTFCTSVYLGLFPRNPS